MAWAQPPSGPPSSPWSAGIMLVWDTQPYKNADGRAMGFPFLSYRGERLEWQGPRLLYTFYQTEAFRLRTHATLQFPAYEEKDSKILNGLGDRAYTMVSGVHALYRLHPRWEVSSRLNVEILGEYHGIQWSNGFSRSFGSPRSSFPIFGSLDLDLVAQDQRWTDYFVGVPEAEARPDRPVYSPSGTVFPAIGGTAIYRLHSDWSLFTTARLDFLGPEWLDSPLIENEYRLQILMALQRRF